MITLGKKREECVGLDIGTSSVKVSSLKREDGEYMLTAYNIKNIPIEEPIVRIEKVIKEALEEVDLHPEEVNLSVSGADVIVRFIDLPKMTKEQLESAMVFEAEKYIPFNLNEVVMDSIILGDEPEAGQMQVLLAAAKRDPIKKAIDLLKGLGIEVNLIDINAFAMFNVFTQFNSSREDKASAFLDIGHSQTNVLISIGYLPCFMRQIHIGGKDIISLLGKSLSIPEQKAGEYMRGVLEGEVDKELLDKNIRSILYELAREIQLSFSYFDNRFGKAINDIYCSGGMVYQEGTLKYLSEKTGTQLRSWSPASGLKLPEYLSREDLDKIVSQLIVSIGLALRG